LAINDAVAVRGNPDVPRGDQSDNGAFHRGERHARARALELDRLCGAKRLLRTLVIADDHQLMRDGLRALIERSLEDVHIVAEAATLHDAEHAVRSHRPDLLVLDLKMPGGSATSTVQTLVREQQGLAILVLTMHDETNFVRSVLGAGARGYLLKQSAYTEFVHAARVVLDGGTYVDPLLRMASSTADHKHDLSDREQQVLTLLARGLTYAEVATELHIGVRTVETHRRKVMEKLGLHSRADLLRYALESGLVSAGDASPRRG
jgi:two-component system response regulator NreC